MLITLNIAVCFILSLLGVRVFVSFAGHLRLIDVPNTRSSHVQPTPRGAGIIFVLVWLGSSLLVTDYLQPVSMALILCALSIALIGFLDDRYNLTVIKRLFFQIAASLSFAFFITQNVGSLEFDFGIFSANPPLLVSAVGASFLLVWSTNIFNFMDGIDGLAATEALSCLIAGALLIWVRGEPVHSILLHLNLLAAVAGFLIWNLPKARVFMGDVGSGFLGFVLMGLALIGQVQFGVPIYLFFLVYGIFVVDTFITLVRRAANGDKWYHAHRQHAYQRLQHEAGWTQVKILKYVSFFNATLFVVALLSDQGYLEPRSAVIIAAMLAIGYYYFAIWSCSRKSAKSTLLG